MMKRGMLAFLVIGLMAVALVSAVPNGQPFQEIWEAISDLQDQTVEITFDTYVVESSVLISSNSASNVFVECEIGDRALSGGYRIDDEAILHHFEPRPYNVANPTGWRFVIINPTTTVTNTAIEVLCLDLTP